jgi:hypothetical protein
MLSSYRLDGTLGLQIVDARTISRQSEYEDGNVVSPPHRPTVPPGYVPVTHFS